MYDLQPAFSGCCTHCELQEMKERDRKQQWLPARTSWENILHSSSSSSSWAAVRQGGSEQLLTKRREGGWECCSDGSGPSWSWNRPQCILQAENLIPHKVTEHASHLSQPSSCAGCLNAGAGGSTARMWHIYPLTQKQGSISSFCLCEVVRVGQRLPGNLEETKRNNKIKKDMMIVNSFTENLSHMTDIGQYFDCT